MPQWAAQRIRGGKGTRSFYDRYGLMMSKRRSLSQLVTSASNSESLRKEIGDFYRSFATRTKCQDPIDAAEAAAVAFIIKISEVNPASRMLVSKAPTKGTGLDRDDLAGMAKDNSCGTGKRQQSARPPCMGAPTTSWTGGSQ